MISMKRESDNNHLHCLLLNVRVSVPEECKDSTARNLKYVPAIVWHYLQGVGLLTVRMDISIAISVKLEGID